MPALPPEKAFEFAANLTQQLVTLSTAIIGFSVTFLNDIVKRNPLSGKRLLGAGWLVHLISMVFGVWTLMALTGALAPLDESSITIRDSSIVIPSALQIISFLAGTALLVVYGFLALRGPKAPRPRAVASEPVAQPERLPQAPPVNSAGTTG